MSLEAPWTDESALQLSYPPMLGDLPWFSLPLGEWKVRWADTKGIALQRDFFGEQCSGLRRPGRDVSLPCSQAGNSIHAEGKAKEVGPKAILEQKKASLKVF